MLVNEALCVTHRAKTISRWKTAHIARLQLLLLGRNYAQNANMDTEDDNDENLRNNNNNTTDNDGLMIAFP